MLPHARVDEFETDLQTGVANAGAERGRELNRTASPPPASANQTLYVTGRPTIKDFVHFVEREAVNVPDRRTLAEQWHAAAEVVGRLQNEDAGAADGPEIRKLGPEYQPLLIEFLKDPLVRGGFNTVPTQVALVELDKLVVYQKHIDLSFVKQLEESLGSAPTDDQIFRTCLPFDHPQPPAKWMRVHHDKFVFMSPSNDLRFLEAIPLTPEQLSNPEQGRNLLGLVGLAVGFGSNFLNAVYAENRLILNNGSHRAYALRKLGVKRVPCIIQHVSTRHELQVVATSHVGQDPDSYLKSPRPLMLKDYFDPRLHQVIPVHKSVRQVTVRFEIDETFVPAF
ncbi:MAG TPA: hypothetical protein VE621_17310 [Bryobacteraceae bacterium]|nr:hypothetical protein [Bryobacteraceae bacterium]